MRVCLLSALICGLASAAQSASVQWQDTATQADLTILDETADTPLNDHAQPHGSDVAMPKAIALMSAPPDMALKLADLPQMQANDSHIGVPPVLDVNPNWLH